MACGGARSTCSASGRWRGVLVTRLDPFERQGARIGYLLGKPIDSVPG
ncbi:hypothetical protein [Sorangium sp. So ce131]